MTARRFARWRRLRSPAELIGVARAILNARSRVGWRRAIEQTWRGPMAPHGGPNYSDWLARHGHELTPSDARTAQSTWPVRPLVSVITPVFNTPPSLLKACYASLDRQSYPHWQWCVGDDASTDAETLSVLRDLAADPRVSVTRLATNGGISVASNAAIALAQGEILVLLDHDDELVHSALHEVAAAFVEAPDLELLYSDEDKLEIDGTRCDPYFKPDWSPDLFLSTMYTCHLTAARRTLVERVGGFREGFEGAQDYDLWLRMVEVTPRVHHIPRVLYHWRKVPGSTAVSQHAKPSASSAGERALASAIARRGLNARVEPGVASGIYRIRHRAPQCLTSILVPTYGAHTTSPRHTARVTTMVRSLSATVGGQSIEMIFVTEDGSLPPDVAHAAREFPNRVVAAGGAFNFSRRINAAAAHATGRFLLLANDDLEPIEAGWLDALLEYADQPAVGAVGARLELPDGRLQHVGILLGVRGVAAHAFHEAPGGTYGYFGSVICARNVSAVTGACLATRRDVFASVGGFDEQLPVDFNDVDYCLKVQAAGLRVLYTPYARLRHHEGASLGRRDPGAAVRQLMWDRWGERLATDPYYHPRLSHDSVDYRLGP